MHYLFFDDETGGTNPQIHSLLTAYFGVYDEKFNLIDELYLQLKPENVEDIRTTPEALKITGINIAEHLADPNTVTYAEGCDKLMDLLERNKIKGKRRHFRPCGHNVDFDIKFLLAQLIEEDSWKKYVHHNTLDTLRILTFLQDIDFLPKDLGPLGSLVEYFKVTMREAHNAKEDIRMTVDVYKAMCNLLKSKKMELGGAVGNSLLEIIED